MEPNDATTELKRLESISSNINTDEKLNSEQNIDNENKDNIDNKEDGNTIYCIILFFK